MLAEPLHWGRGRRKKEKINENLREGPQIRTDTGLHSTVGSQLHPLLPFSIHDSWLIRLWHDGQGQHKGTQALPWTWWKLMAVGV